MILLNFKTVFGTMFMIAIHQSVKCDKYKCNLTISVTIHDCAKLADSPCHRVHVFSLTQLSSVTSNKMEFNFYKILTLKF